MTSQSHDQSVYLACDIPDDANSTFYRGQPVVILKDSVFFPFKSLTSYDRVCGTGKIILW